MFTGIIQDLGQVTGRQGGRLALSTRLTGLRKGDSVAVNGVCLTVVSLARKGGRGILDFDVSRETFDRTNLGALAPGARVNLERPLRVGDLLGGHIVQGHVDGVGRLVSKKSVNAQTVMYKFSIPPALARYVVNKGSIAVDGISLTAAAVGKNKVTVAVIPHTWKNTNLGSKKTGEPVNIEVDILAKHVEKLRSK